MSRQSEQQHHEESAPRPEPPLPTHPFPGPPFPGHPMRRRDRELSREEAEDILRRGEYGVLCTCGDEGMPYGVPLNYVYEGGCVAFHGAKSGHKVQNLRQSARASLTVVGTTQLLPARFSTLYECAIAFGRIRFAEGEEKRALLRALLRKYCPAFLEEGEAYLARDAERVCVFVLDIDQLSGKAHH